MIELTILTKDGEELTTEVAEYIPEELNDKLNDGEVNTVVIGNIILEKFDVKRITQRGLDEESAE